MKYLAVLDYEHMDDGVFLSSLARSLSSVDHSDMLLLHGESVYTERIIQTGVMRDEATIRGIKDLNKRLVALLADEGVPAVGLHGYQRSVISLKEETLHLDRDYLENLPGGPLTLLSTLVKVPAREEPAAISLPRMTRFLKSRLDPEEVFLFAKSEESEIFTESFPTDSVRWEELESEFREEIIPAEFRDFGLPVRLTTAGAFQNLPDLARTMQIL